MLPLVEIKKITASPPGSQRQVLKNIDWQIMPGEHWAIFGPNGSGKSTLLRLLHGDIPAKAGSIAWLGPDGQEFSRIVGKTISALMGPHVQENFQRMGWSVSVRELLLRAEADTVFMSQTGGGNLAPALAMLENLDAAHLLNVDIRQLSQGQLRLVLLARALLRKPKLLLLDECTDGLDGGHKEKLFSLLRQGAVHTAMVFASHRREELPDWINRHCHLANGRLCLGSPPPSPPSVPPRLAPSIRENKPGPPLIKIVKANVYINSNLVLRDICWEIKRGEHWRLSGENGSGKSTLLRLLAGDEVVAAGGYITRYLPKLDAYSSCLEDIRKDYFLVSDLGQATYGYPLNGLELVCSGFDNTVGLYRDISEREKRIALDMMNMFLGSEEAENLARQSIRHMSCGQLRRLYLARAIVGKPSVLLLDEPCTGLDCQARAAYLDLLAKLARGSVDAYSPQIIFVSHRQEDAPSFINREGRMRQGRLEIIGQASELFAVGYD